MTYYVARCYAYQGSKRADYWQAKTNPVFLPVDDILTSKVYAVRAQTESEAIAIAQYKEKHNQ